MPSPQLLIAAAFCYCLSACDNDNGSEGEQGRGKEALTCQTGYNELHDRETNLSAILESEADCASDEDCSLFVTEVACGGSALKTCGIAVMKNQVGKAEGWLAQTKLELCARLPTDGGSCSIAPRCNSTRAECSSGKCTLAE
jgi:hypothetical protein